MILSFIDEYTEVLRVKVSTFTDGGDGVPIHLCPQFCTQLQHSTTCIIAFGADGWLHIVGWGVRVQYNGEDA